MGNPQAAARSILSESGKTGLILAPLSFKIDPVEFPEIPGQQNKEAIMKKCILVVDDDSMNLARTKKILGKDYAVFCASSGTEALNTLRREEVDLVLLDIEMPKMNGFETFERMKDFGADIPVIFLTASGAKDDVVSAIKLGAVNYLVKPFEPQELLRRVAQELSRQ